MSQLQIIIPCKDDFGFAEQALQSIIDQNYKDWSCTIIFDQSPKNIVERIQHFTKDKSRFQLIYNKGNGIVNALNSGIDNINSTPQYITRFDIDDIMPPDRLSQMIATLEHNSQVDLVTGNVQYFSETSISEGYKKYESWLNNVNKNKGWYDSIYRECTIASPNWIMRFNKFMEIGGFRKLTYPEDYDLVFRWYQNNIMIQGIDNVTLLWNEHHNRTSRNSSNYQQQAFFNLKIKRWIEIDYKTKLPVLLLGNNQKAKITAQILIDKGIDFQWFVKNAERMEDTPLNHPISDITKIQQHLPTQVLIAFYEEGAEFEKELQYTFRNNRYFVL